MQGKEGISSTQLASNQFTELEVTPSWNWEHEDVGVCQRGIFNERYFKRL